MGRPIRVAAHRLPHHDHRHGDPARADRPRLEDVNVALHTTPGLTSPPVPHVGAAEHRAYGGKPPVRARAARRAAGPERWMERAGDAGARDAGTRDLDPDAPPPDP